jgi:hypothetical protein
MKLAKLYEELKHPLPEPLQQDIMEQIAVIEEQQFKKLLIETYGNTRLRYVGSVLGTTDEPWIDTGAEIYDALLQMFDEDDLNADPVLSTHPAYTGKHGWYHQRGEIWFRHPSIGEECVFQILDN